MTSKKKSVGKLLVKTGGVSPGKSMVGVAARYAQFVDMYFAHNRNATEAAKACGYSVHTAGYQGARLLSKVTISEAIAKRSKEIAAKHEFTAEEVVRSMARAVRFDPRKLYNADGTLKKITELDDDTALELEGIDIDEILLGPRNPKSGAAGVGSSIRTSKVHFPKKNAVRDQAMRYFGLYAKDKSNYDPGIDESEPTPVSITIDFKDARRKPRT